VILCAILGLAMQRKILTTQMGWPVGAALVLCGMMFAFHDQDGLYAQRVHSMVAMIFALASILYIFWIALETASRDMAPHKNKNAIIINDSTITSNDLVRIFDSFTSVIGRICSLVLMLSGVWLYHIAFYMFVPFTRDDREVPDHKAHLLWMQLSWYFIGICGFATLIEGMWTWMARGARGGRVRMGFHTLIGVATEEEIRTSDVSTHSLDWDPEKALHIHSPGPQRGSVAFAFTNGKKEEYAPHGQGY